MFSEECKYFIKDKNIPMYINDDLEISPDYDEEDSDEENSDKKTLMQKILMKELLMNDKKLLLKTQWKASKEACKRYHSFFWIRTRQKMKKGSWKISKIC